MDERVILHIDLDTFFISCERLLNPVLSDRPVLIGGISERGVVASCSYEARAYGVRPTMTMKAAKNLCPEAVVVRGNSGLYMKKSDEVTQIIKESMPSFEKPSMDEFYVDLTGMDKYFHSFKMAEELKWKIKDETGLPLSFGLSSNKTVAKIATGEAKPNNQLRIEIGLEKPFLAPLEVSKIPMVGLVTTRTLFQMGVRKIGTLQEMPVQMVEKAFGKNGIKMWHKANGIDPSPIVPYQERKSISTERTFERDTTNVHKLRGIVLAMIENLAFQLRRGQRLTSCISIKIRYSDYNTHSLQSRVPFTSADHILIPIGMELFEKLFQKRLLIRLVGVKFSHLVGGSYQIQLFDNAEKISLYQSMDKIRNKFGDRAIMRAYGMGAKTIGRQNPFNGEPPSLLANRKS